MEQDSIFSNDNWNNLYILPSLILVGIFIGLIVHYSEKNEKKNTTTTSIVFACYLFIAAIIYFLNLHLYYKENESSDFTRVLILFFAVPYEIINGIMKVTSNAIGKSDTSSSPLNDGIDLTTLGKKYSGRMTQVENLKSADSYFILNRIRFQKRQSILPCDPYKGYCKVRRSVIYMVFYLAVIVLTPLFITIGETGIEDFSVDMFMGYLNLFFAITFGIVLIFVLSTLKGAAGSDVLPTKAELSTS